MEVIEYLARPRVFQVTGDSAPKTKNGGALTVKIGTYVAVCILSDGTCLLQILQIYGYLCARMLANMSTDNERRIFELGTQMLRQTVTKHCRTLCRSNELLAEEIASSSEN